MTEDAADATTDAVPDESPDPPIAPAVPALDIQAREVASNERLKLYIELINEAMPPMGAALTGKPGVASPIDADVLTAQNLAVAAAYDAIRAAAFADIRASNSSYGG
jgi:hypothetical protein